MSENWIRVKDRLPDQLLDALVWTEDGDYLLAWHYSHSPPNQWCCWAPYPKKAWIINVTH